MIPDSATAFGVYLHWPFCQSKCPYCDFNSHVRHMPPDEERFLEAMARELAHFAALAPGRTVTSVFLGGGTPSLMRPATVAGMIEAVARHWTLDPEAEITLEANPSSVEADRFRGYRAAGVNRVSIGVQALDDRALKELGRRHTAAEARRAVELARETFPRLSFDLIYARPGQPLSAWERELERACLMAADHLSLYQLTIEEGTPFFALHKAGKLVMPEPELAARFYEATQAITAAHGLPAYEISNHARPGAESRHNLTYWRYRDYVGAGPGAHGRLTVKNVRRALATERAPEEWMALVEERGHGVVIDDPLSREEVADEMLLMGLRLTEGVSAERYRQMSGRAFDPLRVADLLEHGMIVEEADGRLRATPAGAMVLDAVVADLAA